MSFSLFPLWSSSINHATLTFSLGDSFLRLAIALTTPPSSARPPPFRNLWGAWVAKSARSGGRERDDGRKAGEGGGTYRNRVSP